MFGHTLVASTELQHTVSNTCILSTNTSDLKAKWMMDLIMMTVHVQENMELITVCCFPRLSEALRMCVSLRMCVQYEHVKMCCCQSRPLAAARGSAPAGQVTALHVPKSFHSFLSTRESRCVFGCYLQLKRVFENELL